MTEEKCKYSLIISNHSKEKNDTKNNDTDHKEKSYKIYNYLKSHPSFFIAILSAAVAMMSVILNYVSFLYTNTYLSYFDISVDVQIKSQRFLYFIALTALYGSSLMLFQSFLSSTFESYMPYKRLFLLYKYSMRFIKKEHRSFKSLLDETKKRADTIIVTNDDKSKLEEIKHDLEMCQRKYEQDIGEYKNIKKLLRKQRTIYYCKIAISCFIAWASLTFICFLLYINGTFEWSSITISSMAISLLFVAFIALENWFLYCFAKMNRKQIKRDAICDKEEDRKLSYDNLPDMPLERFLFGGIKDFFKDTTCKGVVLSMFLVAIVLMITMVYSGKTSAEKQKEFFIVQENNTSYAVIYNNGTMMILEKAELSDNSITIDTTEQMTIDADGVFIKKYIFDEVHLIKLQKNIEEEISNVEGEQSENDHSQYEESIYDKSNNESSNSEINNDSSCSKNIGS